MNSPLRVVYDNAADRATVSASGSVVLPVGNLFTNNKNEVFRTANTVLTTTFTATWFSTEKLGCVAMPYCNFSTTTTMRVRLYSDMACTALLLDTGAVLCSEGGGGSVSGLTAQQSASAYSYGGGTVATSWFAKTANVRGMKVDITDSANLQGYLEAARLVVGDYFQPEYNAEYGANISMTDTTENYRTDAGNLMSDVGTRHKTLSMSLSFMMPADRANLWKLVKYCGRSNPIFVSLFPQNADKAVEEAHTVYGKLSSMSQVAATNYLIFSAPLEIEGL